jgi:hypothetical protein
VRTNFSPFKKGDVVRLKPNFPYVNRELLIDEIYTIDQMFPDAGIVSLVGQDKHKTFPEDAFELLYNGELSGQE